MIANGDDMTQRKAEQVNAARGEMDDYVRSVAGSSGGAGEIERAKGLLDAGAINQGSSTRSRLQRSRSADRS